MDNFSYRHHLIKHSEFGLKTATGLIIPPLPCRIFAFALLAVAPVAFTTASIFFSISTNRFYLSLLDCMVVEHWNALRRFCTHFDWLVVFKDTHP